MAKHSQKAFKNTTVALDGNEFDRCVFDGCTLEFDGSQPVTLNGSSINNCNWVFKGPAGNAVQFMSALYKSGAQGAMLVEATFNQIRGLVVPPAAGASAAAPAQANAPAKSLQ